MQGRHPKGQLRPLLPPDQLRLTKRWVCGLMTQCLSATAPPWHPPHCPPHKLTSPCQREGTNISSSKGESCWSSPWFIQQTEFSGN